MCVIPKALKGSYKLRHVKIRGLTDFMLNVLSHIDKVQILTFVYVPLAVFRY